MLREVVKVVVNFIKRQLLNLKKEYQIGPHSYIMHARLEKNISIGRNCNIRWSHIGNYTYVGENTELPYCEIGRFCSIGPNVYLAAGIHPTQYVSTHPIFYSKSYKLRASGLSQIPNLIVEEFAYVDKENKIMCEIGNDVWIASNVTLVCGKKPLHIGTGAVICAGAVVTKDVPPYAIMMGCPAQIKCYRIEDKSIREKLLKSEWWNRDDEWINKRIALFENPADFVDNVN